MKLELNFPGVKACTANKMKAPCVINGHLSMRPTKEYNKFKRQINDCLMAYKYNMFKFETNFSPYEHFLSVTIAYELPMKELITKKGTISKKSIDLDNTFKTLIDTVFKGFNDLDDSAICEIYAQKQPSKRNAYNISMTLEIVDIKNLM